MFSIDNMSRTPVYEQIIVQVERFIAAGLLKGGDKLPSVRNLSVELSVNPNTIQKAFSELDGRRLIVSVPGKGSFISQEAAEILHARSREKTDDFVSMAKRLYLAGMSEDELKALIEKAIETLKSGSGERLADDRAGEGRATGGNES